MACFDDDDDGDDVDDDDDEEEQTVLPVLAVLPRILSGRWRCPGLFTVTPFGSN